VDFARDAFAHLKAIAIDAGGQQILKAGNVGKDAGVVDAADLKAFIKAAKTRQWDREPKLRLLA
jgi:catalase